MNIDTPRATAQPGDPEQRARQLRPLIEARCAAIERDRVLPQEVLAALHDAGLFRMLLPRSCGGEEVDPVDIRRRRRGDRQGRRQHRMVRGAGVGLLDGRGLPRTRSGAGNLRPPEMPCWPGARSVRRSRRPRSTAAIASPAPGLTPAAAATRSGSAATRRWSTPMASLALARTAGRPSAPCCFRRSKRGRQRRLAGDGA